MATVGKKEIVSAAKELNKVMGLEPRIDIKQEEDKIIKLILEAADWISEDDELTRATLNTIAALKEEFDDTDFDEEEDDDEVDEDAASDDDDEDDDEPEPEPEPVKGKGKGGKGKKKSAEHAPVADDEGSSKAGGKGKGKGKKDAAPAPDKPAPTPPKRPLPPGIKKFGESFTRATAAGTVVRNAKTALTIDEIAAQSNDLYVAKTGNAFNLKEQRWATNVALQALIGYGVVVYKDEKIQKVPAGKK